MDKSTERFLRLVNEQNARIAAAKAREAALDKDRTDTIRLQREKERREKWGQLRAREHPSKHPARARRVFPYIDTSS
jgi:hypothetical protein